MKYGFVVLIETDRPDGWDSAGDYVSGMLSHERGERGMSFAVYSRTDAKDADEALAHAIDMGECIAHEGSEDIIP